MSNKLKYLEGNVNKLTHDSFVPVYLTQLTLTLSSKTSSSVALSWNNPDNLSIFQLYQDGSLQGTYSTNPVIIGELEENTSYVYTVRSGDGNGNWSPMSAPLTVTTDEAGSEPVEPITILFDMTTFRSGLVGPIDETRDANVTYLAAGGRSAWIGTITADEAIFKVVGNNQPSQDANRVEISLNGGAYFKPEVVGVGEYKLENLNNTEVHLKIGGAYGNNSGFPKNEPCLTVTGVNPVVSVPNWLNAHEDTNWKTSAYFNNTFDTYLSFSRNIVHGSGAPYGGAAPSISFRAQDATELKVFTPRGKVSVWVDGQVFRADGSRSSNLDGQVTTVTGLPTGEHQILVVADTGSSYQSGFAVSHNGVDLPNSVTARLDQYGDSITDGRVDEGKDKVDVFEVAHSLGFAASNPGVSGEQISGLLARLDVALPLRQIDSTTDVAILAIGRNDVSTVWDQTKKDNYLAIINKLLTRYRGVLCRGILPEVSQTFPSQNGDIAQIVSDLNNPNVIFIDTSTWLGIETLDGVHPNTQGYHTIAGYAIPAYASALGITI